jgi:prevent-host-death family protein
MQTFDIHDAKTHLPRLVDAASAGEEIVIAKAGKPVARLVPITHSSVVRKFGVLKGTVRIAEDFDAPLPDNVLASFEGR